MATIYTNETLYWIGSYPGVTVGSTQDINSRNFNIKENWYTLAGAAGVTNTTSEYALNKMPSGMNRSGLYLEPAKRTPHGGDTLVFCSYLPYDVLLGHTFSSPSIGQNPRGYLWWGITGNAGQTGMTGTAEQRIASQADYIILGSTATGATQNKAQRGWPILSSCGFGGMELAASGGFALVGGTYPWRWPKPSVGNSYAGWTGITGGVTTGIPYASGVESFTPGTTWRAIAGPLAHISVEIGVDTYGPAWGKGDIVPRSYYSSAWNANGEPLPILTESYDQGSMDWNQLVSADANAILPYPTLVNQTGGSIARNRKIYGLWRKGITCDLNVWPTSGEVNRVPLNPNNIFPSCSLFWEKATIEIDNNPYMQGTLNWVDGTSAGITHGFTSSQNFVTNMSFRSVVNGTLSPVSGFTYGEVVDIGNPQYSPLQQDIEWSGGVWPSNGFNNPSIPANYNNIEVYNTSKWLQDPNPLRTAAGFSYVTLYPNGYTMDVASRRLEPNHIITYWNGKNDVHKNFTANGINLILSGTISGISGNTYSTTPYNWDKDRHQGFGHIKLGYAGINKQNSIPPNAALAKERRKGFYGNLFVMDNTRLLSLALNGAKPSTIITSKSSPMSFASLIFNGCIKSTEKPSISILGNNLSYLQNGAVSIPINYPVPGIPFTHPNGSITTATEWRIEGFHKTNEVSPWHKPMIMQFEGTIGVTTSPYSSALQSSNELGRRRPFYLPALSGFDSIGAGIYFTPPRSYNLASEEMRGYAHIPITISLGCKDANLDYYSVNTLGITLGNSVSNISSYYNITEENNYLPTDVIPAESNIFSSEAIAVVTAGPVFINDCSLNTSRIMPISSSESMRSQTNIKKCTLFGSSSVNLRDDTAPLGITLPHLVLEAGYTGSSGLIIASDDCRFYPDKYTTISF